VLEFHKVAAVLVDWLAWTLADWSPQIIVIGEELAC
jgi:hypothetical protein